MLYETRHHHFKTLKKYITILFFLITQISFGQLSIRHYKRVLKNGFCEDTTIKCINNQYRYLKACDRLGSYYLEKKFYKKAFKYYELLVELDGHSTTIQTDSACKLRNEIIAKAGDMTYFGNGVTKDTVNSFYYHYQYPLNYSIDDKRKYSLLYFKTITDTFNLQTKERTHSKYYFAINPYMLLENQTIQKIANSINTYSLNKDSVSIILFRGDTPLSEEGQALLWKCLDGVKELVQLKNPKLKIEREVDLNETENTKIVNGRAFPIFSVQTY